MSTLLPTKGLSDGYNGLIQAQPYSLLLVIIFGTLALRHWLTRLPKTANFPLLNPIKGFGLVDIAHRRHFAANTARLLREGEMANPGRPFNIKADTEEITILPALMADSLRSEPNLDFLTLVAEDTHDHLPGFEVFSALREQKLVVGVINKYLMKHLNKITQPLSKEASHAMEVGLGSPAEWTSIPAHEHMLDIVARISSHMFLGEGLCRDAEWLDVTKRYTVMGFGTANVLREYPPWLRPLMNHILPQCRELRELSARAKKLIAPVILERQQAREDAVRDGKPVPRFEDALDWFEREGADPKLDPAYLQLILSVVAIHTTSDLLAETILQLSQRPQLVEELRAEISGVLKADGWKKTSLFNMKLLDSVIKESQRLRPIVLSGMTRRALADVTLPTGEVIPKGARIACLTSLHTSPDQYDDPLVYNGHRFVDWRGTDRDSASHLVSTGPASLGFGHGKHACPGRFFASNEIKIALCHLLMKYDWKLDPGQNTDPFVVGFNQNVNPHFEIMMKKRTEVELDIDSVQ